MTCAARPPASRRIHQPCALTLFVRLLTAQGDSWRVVMPIDGGFSAYSALTVTQACAALVSAALLLAFTRKRPTRVASVETAHVALMGARRRLAGRRARCAVRVVRQGADRVPARRLQLHRAPHQRGGRCTAVRGARARQASVVNYQCRRHRVVTHCGTRRSAQHPRAAGAVRSRLGLADQKAPTLVRRAQR
jgi:hypothetical protein